MQPHTTTFDQRHCQQVQLFTALFVNLCLLDLNVVPSDIGMNDTQRQQPFLEHCYGKNDPLLILTSPTSVTLSNNHVAHVGNTAPPFLLCLSNITFLFCIVPCLIIPALVGNHKTLTSSPNKHDFTVNATQYHLRTSPQSWPIPPMSTAVRA